MERAAHDPTLDATPTALADHGVPDADEIGRLLDPRAQTVRGAGLDGPSAG